MIKVRCLNQKCGYSEPLPKERRIMNHDIIKRYSDSYHSEKSFLKVTAIPFGKGLFRNSIKISEKGFYKCSKCGCKNGIRASMRNYEVKQIIVKKSHKKSLLKLIYLSPIERQEAYTKLLEYENKNTDSSLLRRNLARVPSQ